MKPLFGINVTTNKKNETPNLEQFLCQQTSQEATDVLEKTMLGDDEVVEKSEPKWLNIAILLVGIGGLVVAWISGILRENSGMIFEDYIRENPLPIIIMGAVCVGGYALMFYRKRLHKSVSESEEYATSQMHLDTALNNIYMELGVPSYTEDVDIFCDFYKEVNGECVTKKIGISPYDFTNLPNKLFVEDGNLYVADPHGKYCIPNYKPCSIEAVNKRKTFPMWNKKTAFNQGEYKQYKVTYNKGIYSCKSYYILHLEGNGEKWCIYFPNYELPFFEEFTGLKAE